jgi:hypothetical protein
VWSPLKKILPSISEGVNSTEEELRIQARWVNGAKIDGSEPIKKAEQGVGLLLNL